MHRRFDLNYQKNKGETMQKSLFHLFLYINKLVKAA